MTKSAYLLVIGITAAMTLTALSHNSNTKTVDATKDARKKSIGAVPYVGPDYNSRPIVVIGVSTNKEKHVVEKLRLRNISNKSASAVRIGWYASRSSDISNVAQKGESQLVGFAQELRPGENLSLSYRVVSLLETSKALKEEGRFDSAHTIQIAVTEILFADGSRWSDREEVSSIKRLQQVSFSHGAKSWMKSSKGLSVSPLPLSTCFGNASQCVWVDNGGIGYWSCEPAAEPNMFCDTHCTTFCCSYLCGIEEPWCECY